MGTVREGDGRLTSAHTPVLGLLAHDAKKQELCEFASANRHLIDHIALIAPDDTARALAEVGVEAVALAPDTHGGDLQLAAAVVAGEVDAVVFLNDPLSALPAEPTVGPLLKVCDLERVPMATNVVAAEIVLLHVAARHTGRRRNRPTHPAGNKRQRALRLVPFPGADAKP